MVPNFNFLTDAKGRVGPVKPTPDGNDFYLPVRSSSNVIFTGVVNVVTAGTRIQLPDVNCQEITIIAKDTNVGPVYVGDVTTSSTQYGVKLKPDGSFTFAVINANMLYIDTSANGDGISYVAL